jgi:hypothetical protein
MVVRDTTTPPDEKPYDPTLRIFPLPAGDILSIDWGGPMRDPLHWEIVDVTGRRIRSGASADNGDHPVRLRTIDSAGRPMAAGVYWLRVRAGHSSAVRRILVSR